MSQIKLLQNKIKSLPIIQKVIIFAIIGLVIFVFRGFFGKILAFLVFFGILGLPLILVFKWISNNQKKRDKIQLAYQEALDKLRKEPNNSALRFEALQAGRNYYQSLRDGMLTIYDEQAINNDLNTIIGTNPSK